MLALNKPVAAHARRDALWDGTPCLSSGRLCLRRAHAQHLEGRDRTWVSLQGQGGGGRRADQGCHGHLHARSWTCAVRRIATDLSHGVCVVSSRQVSALTLGLKVLAQCIGVCRRSKLVYL